jgi:hypothetical protein
MRKDFAVFLGNRRISVHWTASEAVSACGQGMHVRHWVYGYNSKGGWVAW